MGSAHSQQGALSHRQHKLRIKSRWSKTQPQLMLDADADVVHPRNLYSIANLITFKTLTAQVPVSLQPASHTAGVSP